MSHTSHSLRFIAMVFEMNPELGTLSRDEKDNNVFDQVLHVIDKMKQPVLHETCNGTQEELSGCTTQTQSRDTKRSSRSGVARPSTKTKIQDRVTKRGNVKPAGSLLRGSSIQTFESLVGELSQDRSQMLNNTKPSPNPADYVHPGILLRKIDETYEFDDDDNEILP